MAKIYDNRISIAFDLYGCPQACMHCWLGTGKKGPISFDEAVARFLEIKAEQEREHFYDAVVEYIGLDYREPHYGDNYKAEYAAADRINGTKVDVDRDYRLVSLWRLSRDPSYARWCRDRGIKGAQFKVFGGREVNDRFLGRKGAHEETLSGAEKLLDLGMVPRFQIYLNKPGIDTIPEFLRELAEKEIARRVEEIGEELNVHCMTYSPDGRGLVNHRHQIEIEDVARIPERVRVSTEKHFGKPLRFLAEEEMAEKILSERDGPVFPSQHTLWLFVDQQWDVHPNFMAPDEGWKIGNILSDSWKALLDAYVEDVPPALKRYFTVTRHELVTKNRGTSRKAYMNEGDLLEYYLNLEMKKTR